MHVATKFLTSMHDTVVWKIFVRIYFVVLKYFRVNNFRGLTIPTTKYFNDEIIAI